MAMAVPVGGDAESARTSTWDSAEIIPRGRLSANYHLTRSTRAWVPEQSTSGVRSTHHTMSIILFTDKRWAAHPSPTTPLDIKDDQLVLTTNKGTDWWHTLERDSQDGVVYGFEVDATKGLEISVELDIAHKDRVSAGGIDQQDDECARYVMADGQ